jgi:hypothetical protein
MNETWQIILSALGGAAGVGAVFYSLFTGVVKMIKQGLDNLTAQQQEKHDQEERARAKALAEAEMKTAQELMNTATNAIEQMYPKADPTIKAQLAMEYHKHLLVVAHISLDLTNPVVPTETNAVADNVTPPVVPALAVPISAARIMLENSVKAQSNAQTTTQSNIIEGAG